MASLGKVAHLMIISPRECAKKTCQDTLNWNKQIICIENIFTWFIQTCTIILHFRQPDTKINNQFNQQINQFNFLN